MPPASNQLANPLRETARQPEPREISTHSKFLGEASLLELLDELEQRGGIYGVAARTLKVCAKKTADYNEGANALDPAATDRLRDIYFPFGQLSYAQMIHTKSQRLISLVKNIAAGREPNFEGIGDTYLDIINYALFGAERIERERLADQKHDDDRR